MYPADRRCFGWHGQTCLTVLALVCFLAYEGTLKLRLGVAPDIGSIPILRAYLFRWRILAPSKPLNLVDEAMLYAPMFSV